MSLDTGRYFIFIYIENYYWKCAFIIRANNFGLLHPSVPFLYPFYPFVPFLSSSYTYSFRPYVHFHTFIPFLHLFSYISSFPSFIVTPHFLSSILFHPLLFFPHVHAFLLSVQTPFFFSFLLFPPLLSIILSHCTLHPLITSPLKHRITLYILLEVTFSNTEVLTP